MDTTHPDIAGKAAPACSERDNELSRLGEFRILRKVGEGGMGAVFLAARDGQTAQFAIKVLSDHLAVDQLYVDRFYREARSGVLLNHPNIVRCLAVGQDQATNKHYLVMEYVDGPSVQSLLEKQGTLAAGDAVHIVLDMARALEHAHSRNIVHRDIKPGNILMTNSGVAKLADLGLAKRTDQASNLTGTCQTFGTPHYMPYEQAMNARHADNRSDIYALGATLYHMVTGVLPFTGDNHVDVVDKKNRGEFAPASVVRRGLPRLLDTILDRMLARDPRRRYQTASELIVDLERSHLAARVPSFTDPVVALKDPWVRAQLASDNQPTRPDLQLRDRVRETPIEPRRVWFLRYLDPKGKMRRFRGSTDQVAQQLRKGRFPRTMTASPERRGIYRPLAAYPEFETIVAAVQQAAPKSGEDSLPQPRKLPASARRRSAPLQRRMLLGMGVCVVVLLLAWFVRHILT